MSLQEDEVELANPLFRDIFNNLISYYHQNESFNIENYLMHLQPEFAQEVTDILMEDERLVLHNWEGQNIFPKTKLEQLNQNVTDNLFTLRWYLISQFIENAKNSVSKESEIDNSEVIAEIMDYIKLKTKFSYKTGRVVVRYH